MGETAQHMLSSGEKPSGEAKRLTQYIAAASGKLFYFIFKKYKDYFISLFFKLMVCFFFFNRGVILFVSETLIERFAWINAFIIWEKCIIYAFTI